MSASKRAKELGADSLRWVAEAYGCSESALHKSYRDNPGRFDIKVAGCVSLDKRGRLKEQIQDVLDSM